MSNRSNVVHSMFGCGLFVVVVPGILLPGKIFNEFGCEVYSDRAWDTPEPAEEWRKAQQLPHASTESLTSPRSLDEQFQWPSDGTPEELQVILVPRRDPQGLQVVGALPSQELAMAWREKYFRNYPVGSYSKPLPLQPIERYAANVQARKDAVDALSLVGERSALNAPAEGRVWKHSRIVDTRLSGESALTSA